MKKGPSTEYDPRRQTHGSTLSDPRVQGNGILGDLTENAGVTGGRTRYTPLLNRTKDSIAYAFMRGSRRRHLADTYEVGSEALDQILRERLEFRTAERRRAS